MVIHPGFIKTGTTSLQEFVLFAHPQVHALGHPHRSALDARISQGLRRIEGFEDDPGDLRDAVAKTLAACPDGLVPVLSDETLTADPRLTAATARRLHDHFPDARIVFTLRRQEDLIRSFYGRHGRVLVNTPAPYTDRHVAFPAWLEHAYRNFPAGVLGMADYARTIGIYRALFGAERIAILLLEEWVADAGAFADRLSTILGIDAVTTRQLLADRRTHGQDTTRHVRYDRLSKRFPHAARIAAHVPRGIRGLAGAFLRRGATQRIELPPGWPERLQDLYRNGNRQLMEQYGLPLREHGYAA
jgi:hypothetical protein